LGVIFLVYLVISSSRDAIFAIFCTLEWGIQKSGFFTNRLNQDSPALQGCLGWEYFTRSREVKL
jgi:hypothetical protein